MSLDAETKHRVWEREMMGPAENLVVANTDHQGDRYELFESTLDQAGLWEHLESERKASGRKKEEFFIVVKPNISMMLRRNDIGTYTDPFFVIHLLRLLLDRGYTRLAVVESGNLYGNWFENRSVIQVAARAGYLDESVLYKYSGQAVWNIRVRGGKNEGDVSLIDLGREKAEHDFMGVKAAVGKTWVDADYRIGVSGLKTHFYCYYTAAIKNIYGCLPAQDKVTEYHCKRRVGPWTAKLIADFPVHFSIAAAYSAADGWMGVKMRAVFAKPHTIIAGSDIQAVDRVCAWLIGAEPEKNILYSCLAALVPPRPFKLAGNATPFKKWKNVPSILVFVSNLMENSANIMDFGGSIATGGNDPCFPLKRSRRSIVKKMIFYLTIPVSILCDIGILKLNYRRRLFARRLRKVGKRVPFISMHPYISDRLELFSREDVVMLAGLLERMPGERVQNSGHYIFWGDEICPFKSRFTPAVLGAVEVINYTLERFGKVGLKQLVHDLYLLLRLCPDLFDPDNPYPFCYR